MSEAIAYAGESGAFAEDALLSYFGAAAPSLSVTSFGDVRVAVLDGRAIYGVLPIENLINGTVRETLDLLRDGALEIVGEVVVPVSSSSPHSLASHSSRWSVSTVTRRHSRRQRSICVAAHGHSSPLTTPRGPER